MRLFLKGNQRLHTGDTMAESFSLKLGLPVNLKKFPVKLTALLTEQ
jgi:hypothetical protein